MITVENVSKSFGNNQVIDAISLAVASSTFVALVGPTGCGKTTLLNLLAGLDTPDSGHIGISPTNHIAAGYMMQDHLLLPWRTLSENAILGTEVLTGRNTQAAKTVHDYFQAFDLGGHEDTYPNTASGGMKQRVALIRTLLLSASTLLLDEPFSNLDFDIRLKIQRQLISYQRERKTTILLVTHDIEDAIALAHRVIVLSDRPATVKADILIELGIERRDPVDARKSKRFSEYFAHIWDELKYLDEN
jgi:NitT/TauT family transport system ATP-binding protein